MQVQLNSSRASKCMLTRQVHKLMCENIIYDPPKKRKITLEINAPLVLLVCKFDEALIQIKWSIRLHWERERERACRIKWMHFNARVAGVYLDLALGHPQRIREARSLRTGQVLGLLEGLLQGEDLLAWKGWSGVFLLPIVVQHHIRLGWRNTNQSNKTQI